MNIAFRTDATSQIGTGHFMRCLTLAEKLKNKGAKIRFVSRDLPVHLSEMIKAKGMELAALDRQPTVVVESDLAHSHWLGASQAQDAQATIQALLDRQWNWVVVDHYALDVRWELEVNKISNKIMVIDDIADRAHDCDVLLDQNYYADMRIRYDGKVPARCQKLLGPRYALLRAEFRELREQIKPRTGAVKKIFVFLGGVDADNYTGLALDALIALGNPTLQVDVVIGAQHPHREQIQRTCIKHGYVCHVQTSRMAELMAEADLAIGAGGSASWERCCLGLPAILVALAENQIDIAQALDSIGACVYLGTTEALINSSAIQKTISRMLNAHDQLKMLSQNASALVDGVGVSRVCQELGL